MPKALTKRDPSRSPALIRTFLDEIPRDALAQSWLTSPDKRFIALGQTLLDPRYQHHSILKLCQKYRISLPELLDNWRAYYHGLGTIKLMPHIPQIYEDTAIDAQSHLSNCLPCLATGHVRSPVDPKCPDGPFTLELCLSCSGTGKIRIPGDTTARKLIFESMGMTGRPPQTEVNIGSNNTSTTNIVTDSFKTIIDRANRVMSAKPTAVKAISHIIEPVDETAIPAEHVIDGEIVDPDDPDSPDNLTP